MFLKKNVQPQETVPAPEASPWNTPQLEDVRGHPLAAEQKAQKKKRKRKKNTHPARSKDELQEGNLLSNM